MLLASDSEFTIFGWFRITSNGDKEQNILSLGPNGKLPGDILRLKFQNTTSGSLSIMTAGGKDYSARV